MATPLPERLRTAADAAVNAGEIAVVAALRFRAVPVTLLLLIALTAGAWSWWGVWGPDRFQDVALAVPGSSYTVPSLTDVTVATFDVAVDVDDARIAEEVVAAAMTTESAPVEIPALDDAVTSYLIFSVGSAGLTEEDADRFGVADLDRRGNDGLTDTLMLVLTHPASQRALVLSIPRDTWVPRRGSRINAVMSNHGPQALVDEVSLLTGVPINHLIQVDFAGFGAVIDAVGGVEVPIDRPLRDAYSGLFIAEPGCVVMGGRTALAYVRSRRTQTLSANGNWTADAVTTDIGRVARQQQLIALLWDQHFGPDLITRIPALLGAAGNHIVLDESLGIGDLVELARAFSATSADTLEGLTLPTHSGSVGAASVLFLDDATAAPMLERLRSWPDVVIDPGPASTPVPAGEAEAVAQPVEPPPRYVTGPVSAPTDLCADDLPRTRHS